MGKPESPIEAMFLEALKEWTAADGVHFRETPCGNWIAECDGLFVSVIPQAETGPYRADFGILAWKDAEQRAIAVELDGHEFHEKTKDQAAKDKRRDRYFAHRGMTVLRFTGSEVHRDARACVEETMACLLAQPVQKVKPDGGGK